MIHLLLLAGLFLAAYGNAMRKVTFRRRLATVRGAETAGTSTAYDRTALALFVTGLVVIAWWLAWVCVGNPVVLLAT